MCSFPVWFLCLRQDVEFGSWSLPLHLLSLLKMIFSLSLFVCLSVCLFVSLSVSVFLFVCLFVCLSVSLSLFICICLNDRFDGKYYLHFCTVIMCTLVFPKCLISSLLVTYKLAVSLEKRHLFSLLMANLSTLFYPCKLYSLICGKIGMGWYQVCNCFWVAEIGQRSTECKISFIKNLPILHKNTWCTSLMSFGFTRLSMHDIYLGQRSFKNTKQENIVYRAFKIFHIRNASNILYSWYRLAEPFQLVWPN